MCLTPDKRNTFYSNSSGSIKSGRGILNTNLGEVPTKVVTTPGVELEELNGPTRQGVDEVKADG